MDELVAIAKTARPRGLKGELVCDLLTDYPERFEGLKNTIGLMPDGSRSHLIIEKFWFQKGRVVLKFEGIDRIEEAEKIREMEVCIPESEAVALDEGEFFDWELIDCEVVGADGISIGRVKEVMRTGGTENLAVSGADKEYLIPFAEAICIEVDIEKKIIRIDPPEGLLDF